MLCACDDPGDDEQQIGEAIEVANNLGPNVFGLRQCEDPSFRTAHDGAREMAGSSGWSAARQDEFLQTRQIRIEFLEVTFETVDKILGDGAVPRNAKLATEFE